MNMNMNIIDVHAEVLSIGNLYSGHFIWLSEEGKVFSNLLPRVARCGKHTSSAFTKCSIGSHGTSARQAERKQQDSTQEVGNLVPASTLMMAALLEDLHSAASDK